MKSEIRPEGLEIVNVKIPSTNETQYAIYNHDISRLELDSTSPSERECIAMMHTLTSKPITTKLRKALIVSDDFNIPVRIGASWVESLIEDHKTSNITQDELETYFRDLIQIGFLYRKKYAEEKGDKDKEWHDITKKASDRLTLNALVQLVKKNPQAARDLIEKAESNPEDSVSLTEETKDDTHKVDE